VKNSLFIALLLYAALLLSNEESTLMPTGRAIYTTDLGNNNFALSLMGEGGVRNGRAGATAAFQLNSSSRLKLSGEFLAQKLTFGFKSGHLSRWVEQGAFGLDYEWLTNNPILKAIDCTLYTSYAPSKKLSSTPLGSSQLLRRITGSSAMGGGVGIVWMPFQDNLIKINLDWDHLRLRRKFSHHKTLSGLGGELSYTLRLPYSIDLTFQGQCRRLFNYLGGRIDWKSPLGNPQATLALFGGHTQGRDRLPNSSIIGLELSYLFSCSCLPCEERPLWDPLDLVSWAQIPAVYMPEVLAIAEEKELLCTQFPTSDSIPFQIYQVSPGGGTPAITTLPLASFFHSSLPLTFTVAAPPFDPAQFPITVAIDPSTGTLTITNIGDQFESSAFAVTITATNRCGSTSQLVQLYPNIGPSVHP
jgi:hypothetical protein